MATAQEALARLLSNQVTGIGNIANVNIFKPGIVEFISVGTQTLNGVVDPAPATRFRGGIVPFFTQVSGAPWKEYLVFPSTTQAGDKVSITIDGNTYTATLPAGTAVSGTSVQYDGDRINIPIPNAALILGAGDDLGGPLVNVQSGRLGPGQRGLVVYEHQPESAGGGSMYVIHPNQASGIPLPAFKTVTANPATGQLVGEAILNTTTGLSYVWDGLSWNSIVPAAIVTYPTDSDILTDAMAANGTYAFSQSTGNLFVRYNDGTQNIWREIGIVKYSLQTGLLATSPADGSIGYASDTKNYFVMVGSNWQPFGEYKDTEANILTTTYTDGTTAFASDTQNRFILEKGAWRPFGEYKNTEANILASSYADGTTAYATDTYNRFIVEAGAWQPFGEFRDTEANILANVYTDGSTAYATDTQNRFVVEGSNWQPLGEFRDTEANILASNYTDGSTAYATDTGLLYIRVAGQWRAQNILYDTDANIHSKTASDNQIAVATDTGTVYMSELGIWLALTPRHFSDIPSVIAWTPDDGQQAITDEGLTYSRVGGLWVPKSVYNDTETNILLRTGDLSGQMAVATDTNKLYTWDAGVSAWIGQPFRSYDTEVELDAATPPDGVVGVSADTAIVAFRAAGQWIKSNRSVNIIMLPTAPSGVTAGNLWLDTDNNSLNVYDGTNWIHVQMGNVGDLIDVDTATTPAKNKDVLRFDDTVSPPMWKPQPNIAVEMGSQPPTNERVNGMLWWSGSRVFVWLSPPGTWVEV